MTSQVVSQKGNSKFTLFVPDDVLFALNKKEAALEKEFRLFLAMRYYEMGALTTGLAAKFAGVPRNTFFHLLSEAGISPFGVDADELESDLAYAAAARHQQ